MYGDRYNIEELLSSSVPNGGYCHVRPIDAPDWKDANGAFFLSGSGDIRMKALEMGTHDLVGIQFQHTADSDDKMYLHLAVPDDYDPITDKLRLALRVRKFDATDENTDLKLVALLKHFGEGDATPAAESAQEVVLDGSTAGTAWTDWQLVDFVFDGAKVKPGGLIEIAVYPHEAVGSTDMKLEVIAAQLHYWGNVSLNDTGRRGWTA